MLRAASPWLSRHTVHISQRCWRNDQRKRCPCAWARSVQPTSRSRKAGKSPKKRFHHFEGVFVAGCLSLEAVTGVRARAHTHGFVCACDRDTGRNGRKRAEGGGGSGGGHARGIEGARRGHSGADFGVGRRCNDNQTRFSWHTPQQ